MISILRHFSISVLVLFLMLSSASADNKEARAIDTINRLLKDAYQTIEQRGQQDLQDAISPYFAFELWGRFLIQPRKDVLNIKQQRAVRQLLPGFMAHLYYAQFSKGFDQSPSVNGARSVRKDMMVSSGFPRSNGSTLEVEWRVRDFHNDEARVIDIMVGGTSFALLKREEFTAIIDRDGPDGLIEYLRRNSF